MGKRSPAPPPAPDYAGLARQQGAANVEAARTTAYMSNPNVYTPYGSQTVTWSKTPNFNEQGYQEALNRWQSGSYDDTTRGEMPTPEQFTTYIEQPTVRQELPYWAQTAVNNELQANARMMIAANAAAGRLGDLPIAQAFTGAGMPGVTYSGASVRPIEAHLNLMGYGTPVSQVTPLATPEPVRIAGQAGAGPTAGMYGIASGGPSGLQLSGLDMSGVGGVAQGPTQGQFGMARQDVAAPTLQGQIDVGNLAAAPIAAGTTAQQAIMSRLQPQLQQERDQLYTQLVNQGLTPGTEAFRNAMTTQSQKENDLMMQAAAQGIALDQAARQQGFAEQQARAGFANQAALQGFGAGMERAGLYNVGLQQNLQGALATQAAQNAAQQQAFQQRLAAGEFGREAQLASFGTQQQAAQQYNQAIGQNFQQAMAAQEMANQALAQNQAAQIAVQQANLGRQQQNFGQQMASAELANAALQQQRQAAIDQNAFYNQALQQMYNQEMAQSQFYNTAVQQALQNEAFKRSLPINEISALMAGGQVNVPQFQGYSGVNVAPAPVFQAGQAAGDYAQRNYQNQLAGYNAQMGLLGGLAGMAGTALGGQFGGALGAKLFQPSDRRLKSNIVRIGTHPLGIGVYEYDIFGNRERGVMADELEQVMPEAVVTGELGFKMVNYGIIL